MFEKLIDVNLFNDIYFFLIFAIQINPTCSTYSLQSLQGHSLGTHFFGFCFGSIESFRTFYLFCQIIQIFGAKSETNSVPYHTSSV